MDDVEREAKRFRDEKIGALKNICASTARLTKHLEGCLSKYDQDMIRKQIKKPLSGKSTFGQGARIFQVGLANHRDIEVQPKDSLHSLTQMNKP